MNCKHIASQLKGFCLRYRSVGWQLGGFRGFHLCLLDTEHVEHHDVNEALRGYWQRIFVDQNSKLLQQALRRDAYVFCIYLREKHSLDVQKGIDEPFVEISN